MDTWSLAQLKAHKQFLSGRIDGIKWGIANIKDLTKDQVDQAWNRIRTIENDERELYSRINKILEERAEKRANDPKQKRDGLA